MSQSMTSFYDEFEAIQSRLVSNCGEFAIINDAKGQVMK